jgi:1-acyl-sn-glycerol-3-phosphate acyltransferase
VYTIVLGTLSLTSSLFQKTGYFAHWCARTWSRLILATTGVRVEVVGLEKLERDRTYVFVSNHQSIYDIPVLFWSLPYQLRIIAKESIGRFPFLGWHLSRTGHMLVDRSRPDRAKIFGWASRLTSNGLCLIVFPEGTRSRDGRVGRFKGGSFFLALQAGLPVVPISVVGSRHVMLKGRLATYPGNVRLVVHEPIDTTALADADPREFAERVRQIIAPAAESDVDAASPDRALSSAVEALRRA